MTWAEFHAASEKTAMEAGQFFRDGNITQALPLYAKAAELEQHALAVVDTSKVRTRGITAVSAVSLWYKAVDYDRAEQLAHSMLGDPSIPAFARIDLRNLVQAIWTESSKQAANVSFLPGQVYVSVKGGEVVTGGAPLDLVIEKVQTIQAMFYRTIEFIKDMPLRPRGAPIRDIQEACRPWLFQAAPGSYQFSVAIQEPKQRDFFKEDIRPDLVATQFLDILRATTNEDQRQLEQIVPSTEYRNVFLKLSRNLAPTGKTFGSIEFRTSTGEAPIALTPDARTAINETLKKGRPPVSQDAPEDEEEIVGMLRAVDLDKDWLDVTVNGQAVHVTGLGDAMDDLIGPMVNKMVKVQIVRKVNGPFRFRDIEVNE
ncbi:hypothetical protein EDE15_4204 [Edaphobacter aggregans]|uniref:Uncharacterized protein n=1 Tax=Edaphobacter aggregans TaxID=570835 RepID=A0A3R9NZQ6_9BACT|nr:hypothetical protein [Edaphobacter aggregans]RSL18614.1 hypothetical protein EDE15_4204 [Edaphobacter aggregans]